MAHKCLNGHELRWVKRDRTQDRFTVVKGSETQVLTITALRRLVAAVKDRLFITSRQLDPVVHAYCCTNCDYRDR